MVRWFLAVIITMSQVAFAEETTLEAKVQSPQEVSSLNVVSTKVCSQGEMVRKVELREGKNACEVHYKKETEQQEQDEVIWVSKHDSSYCEKKAADFVIKLQSLGWTETMNTQMEGVYMSAWQKDGRSVNITIMIEDGTSVLMILQSQE